MTRWTPVDLLDPVVLVDPVDPVHPLDPVDPVDLVDLLDALDPLDPLDLVDPVDLIAVDPVDIPKLKHSRCRSGMTFHSCFTHGGAYLVALVAFQKRLSVVPILSI